MSFPGWLAPIIGPIAGVVLYVYVARQEKQEISTDAVIVSIAVGLVVGCIIWLGEYRSRRSKLVPPRGSS